MTKVIVFLHQNSGIPHYYRNFYVDRAVHYYYSYGLSLTYGKGVFAYGY